MKQTLFHEVGHALGLAHNFKGSLSFDRKDPKSIFSSSIMDYNDYEIERQAFNDTKTSDGPQLEYDRQALSAIYDKMADVTPKDKVMPTCNDTEADTEATGSVDPLCIRYDIEKDPTLSVETALNRITSEKLAGDVTLIQALDNVTQSVLTDDALAKVVTAVDAKALQKQLMSSLNGALNFYYSAGKASLARVVKTNIKSLYVFEDGVLSADYVEKDMRERAFKGVEAVLSMTTLPDLVKKKIASMASPAATFFLKTKYGTTLSTSDSDSLVKGLTAQLTGLPAAYEKDPAGLLKVRTYVIPFMARISTLPLFFGTVSGASLDFETALTTLLFESAVDTTRKDLERLAAAKSLMTYQGRLGTNALLARAKAMVDEELMAAKDNDSRELALSLKALLGAESSTKVAVKQ